MTKFVRSKWVNVAKQTVCFGCCRQFPKGTLMDAQTMCDEDGIWSMHLCPTCESLVDEHIADGDNYEEGYFKIMAPLAEVTQGVDYVL